MTALIEIVGVEDTPHGPRDLEAIDGDELTIRVTVDGEVTFGNGISGFFGGSGQRYTLQDLIGERELGGGVRLELRILEDLSGGE